MTDEEKIVARILDVVPPRSFELATFFSLFRVRFSDAVETACVTCGNAPELLLNKAFVETHCRTGEHLFMLVMHELYHVILGHTTLFPHATEVRNLVFDAVINAILCTLFPQPAFMSFFTNYYPADKMPFALLRPKGAGTPPEAEDALRLLYGGSDTGTYQDVFEALIGSGCLLAIVPPVGRGVSEGDLDLGDLSEDGNGGGKPVLLGSHGQGKADDGDMSSGMKDLLHEIISKWPSPDRPLAGRDLGAAERPHDFDTASDPAAALRRGLRRLMRRAALPGLREMRRRAVHEVVCEADTFLPEGRDRTHAAREAVLGVGGALVYRSSLRARHPVMSDNRQAYVYFDVSGSVADQVPSVAQALLPYCRKGLCTVHVFSTVVRPASAHDLAARKFSSTGGTDIDCVLRHALGLPPRRRPRAVVVVTDGFTGCPNAGLAARFRAAGMRLFVGLVKTDPGYDQEADLSSIADTFIKLF